MPTLIRSDGQRIKADRMIVKANGWVKYERDGGVRHYPPGNVRRIEERDPGMKTDLDGNETGKPDSDVIYQSPHGQI